ncbi:hypothetical protein SLS56_000284 [Neofusicoccum ribis]|uniref:Malate dehydrogenase n=1 Tax=Neofusicoccum ribis TaxID=45134 RepID=A0ABR3TG49_9PEZI
MAAALRPRTTTLLTLLLSLLATLALASPVSSPSQQDARSLHRRTPDLSCLTLPTIPNAPTPLPAPTGLKLKHVALGVGTQNYSCATPQSSAVPSSAGALASLYDIGPFLASPIGHLFEKSLPPLALAMYGALSATEHRTAWTAVIEQMPWAAPAGGAGQDMLSSTAFGEHFFAEVEAALTPTWDLLPPAAMYPDEAASILFQGKKEATAAAPADACQGLAGEGAVPWLFLSKAASSDDAISAVYRVVTAGGMQPDTCEGVAATEVEVKYAAEYWFYGPE